MCHDWKTCLRKSFLHMFCQGTLPDGQWLLGCQFQRPSGNVPYALSHKTFIELIKPLHYSLEPFKTQHTQRTHETLIGRTRQKTKLTPKRIIRLYNTGAIECKQDSWNALGNLHTFILCTCDSLEAYILAFQKVSTYQHLKLLVRAKKKNTTILEQELQRVVVTNNEIFKSIR